MVEKNDTDNEFETVLDEENLPKNEDIELEKEDELLAEKLKSLREKLKSCEDEKMKALEDLQRTRADFLNSKRRLEEQFLRDKERAGDRFLEELLPLVDSFDTAMGDRALWDSIDARWRVGVEAIHAKLMSILSSNNVTPLEPLSEKFDPEEHEAVANSTVTNPEEVDTVTAVLQKGFKRNGNLIRPAKVVVGIKA